MFADLTIDEVRDMVAWQRELARPTHDVSDEAAKFAAKLQGINYHLTVKCDLAHVASVQDEYLDATGEDIGEPDGSYFRAEDCYRGIGWGVAWYQADIVAPLGYHVTINKYQHAISSNSLVRGLLSLGLRIRKANNEKN